MAKLTFEEIMAMGQSASLKSQAAASEIEQRRREELVQMQKADLERIERERRERTERLKREREDYLREKKKREEGNMRKERDIRGVERKESIIQPRSAVFKKIERETRRSAIKKVSSGRNSQRVPVTLKPSSSLSVKPRKGNPALPSDLVALVGPKRDMRTPAQVQDDIRARKVGVAQKFSWQAITKGEKEQVQHERMHISGKKLPERVSDKTVGNKATERPLVGHPRGTKRPKVSAPRLREEYEDDGFIEDEVEEETRREIWKIFGRDRREYISRIEYSDDEDMEATGAEVYREEAKAQRLAIEEDEREARLEEAARLRKRKRVKK